MRHQQHLRLQGARMGRRVSTRLVDAGQRRVELAWADGQKVQLACMSLAEIALAIALTDARVTKHLPPAEAVELVVVSVEIYGASQIAAWSEWDRRVNSRLFNGAASTTELKQQRKLWGGRRRSQACTDAAYRLVLAVENGPAQYARGSHVGTT